MNATTESTTTNEAPATVETIPTAAPKRPTVHALPRNLARLADHAGETTRYATGAVHVRFEGETYTAEATDTKQLVRVSGRCVVPSEDFPLDSIPALASAPNGATSALVPAATWKKAFASAKKLRNATSGVGVVTGETVTTFGTTDHATSAVESAANVEGKFPNADYILDSARNNDVAAEFSVDAAMLADVLKSAVELVGDNTDHKFTRIAFRVPKHNRAIILSARREDGTEFTAIVMPLNPA